MNAEKWKSWDGLDGIEASNLGRIRSAGRILTPRASMAYVPGSVKSSMYPKVRVRRPDGTRWWVAVHRIVCDAWLGPCPDGWHRAHLNGDVRDNRLVNLAIVPARVNMIEHRVSQGHAPIYKLSEEDITRGLELYAKPGVTVRDVEVQLGVGQGTFAYHLDRLGLGKGGKLSLRQRQSAAERLEAGESLATVAASLGMSPGGLSNCLHVAGLRARQPRKVSIVNREVEQRLREDHARGARLSDIARDHNVPISTVIRLVGRKRRNKSKHTREHSAELVEAAKTMKARELAERFNIPLHSARYHIRMARHDAQTHPA